MRPVRVLMLLLCSCSGCPSSSGPDDAGPEGCTYASCEETCRGSGSCYGSCGGGVCHCTSCGGDADVRDDGDAGTDGDGAGESELRDGDGVEDGARDDGRDISGCEYATTGETRGGASPGVVCRRLSLDAVEEGLLSYSGSGDRVVLSGGDPGTPLWEVRLSTGCLRMLDDSRDRSGNYGVDNYPSVEGNRVAYAAYWRVSADVDHCELRLLDLDGGEARTFAANDSANLGEQTCWMNYVALEYPWIAWRDVREVPLEAPLMGAYHWDAVALNAETGEIINLSLDPATGDRVWRSVVRVDMKGGWVVFDAAWGGAGTGEPLHLEIVAANVLSGERRQITDAIGDQYFPTVAPPWVAWVDDRAGYPDCERMGPCFNDIYGYNLDTREERALVVADDAMQGDEVDGEGPWLVYEDQRGGSRL